MARRRWSSACGRIALRRQRHRHDVVRVVAFGGIGQRARQMIESRAGIAGIQGDGRGVDPFLGRLGRGGPPGRFALADPQVEVRPLLELALLRVALHDGAELDGGALIVVALQRAHAVFVHGERFVIARLARRRRRRRGRLGRPRGARRGPRRASPGALPSWRPPVRRRLGDTPGRDAPAGRGPCRGSALRLPSCRLGRLAVRAGTFSLPGLFGHAVSTRGACARTGAAGKTGPSAMDSRVWSDRTN